VLPPPFPRLRGSVQVAIDIEQKRPDSGQGDRAVIAEGGQYGPDQAQGHRVLRLMEGVGRAAADDRLDAEDVARLALALELPGGRVVQVLVPVAEQVLSALEDDGRVDAKETLSIAGSLFSAVLALRA
jgi:hypothetical protein